MMKWSILFSEMRENMFLFLFVDIQSVLSQVKRLVNEDFTVSPCAAPGMVWGLRESDNQLVLVKKGSNNQLVFDSLPLPF